MNRLFVNPRKLLDSVYSPTNRNDDLMEMTKQFLNTVQTKGKKGKTKVPKLIQNIKQK